MISIALLVIALSLFGVLLKRALKANEYWEKRGIKYLKPLPFVGNMLPCILGTKSPQGLIQDLYTAYPNELVVGSYELMSPRLYFRDPELIQKVLIQDFGHFTDHGIDVNTEKNPRDETLVVVNGSRWRALRAKLAPIFTSGKLKEMYSIMSSVGTNLIEYLKERENEEIDSRELMGLFSTDVISTAVFGMDPATLKNPNCEFRKMAKEVSNPSLGSILRFLIIFAFPKLNKTLGISFQSRRLTNYFCNIIQNAFNIRKEKGIQRNDFIQMMMELKEKGQIDIHNWDASDDYLKSDEEEPTQEKLELTDDLLMAQAILFMQAGFENTAMIMAYTMFEFTQHQDLQNKICEEVQEQVRIHGGLTHEAVRNCKLLECSIKETLRMYPFIPFLVRICTKDYELPNGYVIKKGERVSIPHNSIHMDPNIYPDPKVYNPERFLEPIKPGTFLPFGEGPRLCIAMRYAMLVMKYGLALFFMNYKVKLSPKTTVPLKINNRTVIALPKEKILIQLEKIQIKSVNS